MLKKKHQASQLAQPDTYEPAASLQCHPLRSVHTPRMLEEKLLQSQCVLKKSFIKRHYVPFFSPNPLGRSHFVMVSLVKHSELNIYNKLVNPVAFKFNRLKFVMGFLNPAPGWLSALLIMTQQTS